MGIFSSGLIGANAIGGAPFDGEAIIPGLYSQPAKFNRFDVIYLSCGEEDNRIDPGGHEWKVWRRNLASFVQLLFK